jgi:hypothetical protein
MKSVNCRLTQDGPDISLPLRNSGNHPSSQDRMLSYNTYLRPQISTLEASSHFLDISSSQGEQHHVCDSNGYHLNSLIVQTLTLLQRRHLTKRLRTKSPTRQRRTTLSHRPLITLQHHPPSPLQSKPHPRRSHRVLLNAPTTLRVRRRMQATARVPQLIQHSPVSPNGIPPQPRSRSNELASISEDYVFAFCLPVEGAV